MIFLDNNSTTPLDEIVKDKMMKSLTENFGNPHSNFHKYGLEANQILEESRSKISKVFNTDTENIIFTSGATEANNLIIQGAALKAKTNKSKKNKIFCSSIEHKCVLDSVNFCGKLGFDIEMIPVNKEGIIDINDLCKKINDETLLISVMAVNNETGLRTNFEEISDLCKKYDVFFHSDVAQALHSEKFDLNQSNIDAVSISGHKIHGPKGVGCLIFRDNPSNFIEPIMYGGLQEQNLRSGTSPVFLAVGLSVAIDILNKNFFEFKNYTNKLKNDFLLEIQKKSDDVYPNFNKVDAHPGTVNLFLNGVDADMMCMRLGDKVALSSTAACNGVDFEYSYVLKNMGLTKDIAKSSIRLCFSRQNKENEALEAANLIIQEYKFIRENL